MKWLGCEGESKKRAPLAALKLISFSSWITHAHAGVRRSVFLSHMHAHVGLPAALAGPNFVVRSEFVPGAFRYGFRGSSQGVIAACRARLAWCLSWVLFARLQSGHPGLQRVDAFRCLGKGFPYWRFIKDLQNV